MTATPEPQVSDDQRAVNSSSAARSRSALTALVADNDQQLARITALLNDLDVAQFTASEAPNDSIGGHVRHLLEHYDQLFHAQDGRVDYDERQRDARLEACPDNACRRIAAVREALPRLRPGPIRLAHGSQSPHDPRDNVLESSVERELHFLVSHTVHHMALIALFARRLGLTVPASFGVTPSTLNHRLQGGHPASDLP